MEIESKKIENVHTVSNIFNYGVSFVSYGYIWLIIYAISLSNYEQLLVSLEAAMNSTV